MLGDKQNQKVDGSSTAIQAGNNVYIHQGMTISDAREVFQLLLRESLTAFQDEARNAAQINFQRFSENVERKFSERIEKVVLEKLAEPDVQSVINDAFKASARKGNSTDIESLANLIVERLSKDSSPYKDIVISEAINVVPRITKQQISFISFYFSVRHLASRGDISVIESLHKAIFPLFQEGINLPISQLSYLEYAGCCTINTLVGVELYDEFNNGSYKHLGAASGNDLKSLFSQKAPTFYNEIEIFLQKNLGALTLTSVGQAIALSHISTVIGNIDYGIWLR
ncbi:LPO_1073/Vpar_1526 family protein [Nitrospirillum pindoramense]|uniref:Uncharacterized protein n=1 Tax=Nitrospirillum amazonense TaxID=28077 RepID=A0A560H8Y5_9PROT|nr:LPO_1073/Vpar_1526 family protein [Nitrospirillum amazonense]TWB42611.1 hypothetical protein FBZ90_106211 [Nitrospirillum amazonense]